MDGFAEITLSLNFLNALIRSSTAMKFKIDKT
jgi:hypothetical protein